MCCVLCQMYTFTSCAQHCDGLTDSEFENKMRVLTEQRPKWEESYLNFTSCRERCVLCAYVHVYMC